MGMESRFGQGGLNHMVDTAQLLSSIGIDEAEIAWRKQHIDFDEEDARRLSELEPVFREHKEEIADRFYENLTPHDRTMAVIARSEKGVEQLKMTQRAYLVTLATGDYDLGYFRNRARIGKIHELLDMPLHFYIGQYGVYYNLLFELLDERVQDQVVAAIREWADEELGDEGLGSRLFGSLRGGDDGDPLTESFEETVRSQIHEGVLDLLAVLRALNLDMQVAVDTYVDSYSQKLEAEIERRRQLAEEVSVDVEAPLADISEAAEQVAANAQQISSLAHESEDAARTVAEEVEDVSAGVQEVAATAETVQQRTETARATAREGHETAVAAGESMARIDDAATDVADELAALDSLFAEFDDTLDVVDDIARRTKHLGRRATLGATQVGGGDEDLKELADEVKAFAEETEDELTGMHDQVEQLKRRNREAVEAMRAVVDEVADGTEQVEAALSAFDEVVEAVDEAADGIEDVAAATETQAESAERVAAAAEDSAAAAERAAERTDDIAAATQEQQAQLQTVANNVGRLVEDE
jgi:heme-based aerotactic transducer